MVLLPEKTFSNDNYVLLCFIMLKRSIKKANEAAMDVVKCPFGKFLTILLKYSFLKKIKR